MVDGSVESPTSGVLYIASIDELTMYFPGGKYTRGPVTEEELHSEPHRDPSGIALFIAAVLSSAPTGSAPYETTFHHTG
jgi:hypothetical protein